MRFLDGFLWSICGELMVFCGALGGGFSAAKRFHTFEIYLFHRLWKRMTLGQLRFVWALDIGYRYQDYSFLRATIGSTPAARRAGITDARTAANASSSVAKMSMIGSQGFTPNN